MDASEMSSEHDESAERLHEPSEKSDTEKKVSPAPKGQGEHTKPRRRGRRGKRRKQRKDSGAICESETQEEHELAWNSDEELDCDVKPFVGDVVVRPPQAPKAPENSTQFIIDDHNDCLLFMSFETPNPYLAEGPPVADGNANVNNEPDWAYIDIDYEYQSPQDFDNHAYQDRDFEQSYKNNRFEELLRLPKGELITGLQNMEAKLRELSDNIVRESPSPILERLQGELLELQEKNLELKRCNEQLSKILIRAGGGSAAGESPASLQTTLDGFSPKSDLVSPTHTVESRLSEDLDFQSPMKIGEVWSPRNQDEDRRNWDEVFDNCGDKKTMEVSSTDESTSEIGVSNCANNFSRATEVGSDLQPQDDLPVLVSGLKCSQECSPKDKVASLEEVNSLTV